MTKKKKIMSFEIVKTGDQLVLPQDMDLEDCISFLQAKKEEEEEFILVKEEIDAFVWDGAFAMGKALLEVFGMAKGKTIQTFFGPQLPQMVSIDTDIDETDLVPWGNFTLPAIPGTIKTGYKMKEGRFVFQIEAEVQKKHEHYIRSLAAVTRRIVREESIYRKKAIRVRFRNDEGEQLPMPEPRFLDLRRVDEKGCVFSREVTEAINNNVFIPIERRDDCKRLRIPAKRGILFAGDYGTGKTLVAYVTAKKATKSGWTFVLCSRADELTDAIRFARQYAPAIVFCEDIDRVTSGDRNISMDDILNTLDGIESKSTDLMVVLTTNDVLSINKAMLRPGRVDALIEVTPPDAEAVRRLIHLYGRGYVPKDADLLAVSEELAGDKPAVIGEVVEKAKLAAIGRSEPGTTDLVVDAEALMSAAISMRSQRNHLREVKEILPHDSEILGDAIGRGISRGVKDLVELTSGNGADKAAGKSAVV